MKALVFHTPKQVSHRLPLERAPHGYEIFNKKEEKCTKVVLKPWD